MRAHTYTHAAHARMQPTNNLSEVGDLVFCFATRELKLSTSWLHGQQKGDFSRKLRRFVAQNSSLKGHMYYVNQHQV